MKRILSALALAASLAGFLPAASAAAYTPFGSVFYFDAKRAEYNASHKTITEATIDGSIIPEVARIQAIIVNGQTMYAAFPENMTAVETHCKNRKLADHEPVKTCYTHSVAARLYPTISKGL